MAIQEVGPELTTHRDEALDTYYRAARDAGATVQLLIRSSEQRAEGQPAQVPVAEQRGEA